MPHPDRSKRAYSIAELAQQLGVSTASIRRLIDAKQIRTIRLGRRVLIPTPVVEALCDPHD
jgi:excisionase family DNA binding protein